MFDFALTRHAARRSRQRGVTSRMLKAMIAWADLEVPAGDGCTILRFSRERLQDRELRGELGPLADRLGSLVMILAGDADDVVTVLRLRRGGAGRRYRCAH